MILQCSGDSTHCRRLPIVRHKSSRQRDDDSKALFRLSVRNSRPAAMERGYFAHDGKSQAAAVPLCVSQPDETIENEIPVFSGDPGAVVLDFQRDRSSTLDRHGDVSGRPPVTKGMVEERAE